MGGVTMLVGFVLGVSAIFVDTFPAQYRDQCVWIGVGLFVLGTVIDLIDDVVMARTNAAVRND